MTDQRASLTIRMPRSLLDRLKAAADARSHSMNAEIVQRLEATLFEPTPTEDGGLHIVAPDDIMERFVKAAQSFAEFESLVEKFEESTQRMQNYLDDAVRKNKVK